MGVGVLVLEISGAALARVGAREDGGGVMESGGGGGDLYLSRWCCAFSLLGANEMVVGDVCGAIALRWYCVARLVESYRVGSRRCLLAASTATIAG